ncbi:MAG: putative spermidine/putrescine transport system substrate-binding protein, partial [Frankiales bacterium]|nr:putative spermidine/putrescine transport system substrate-binding protein [Frankiales bacterium]
MRTRRRTSLLALAGAGLLVLSACAGGSGGSKSNNAAPSVPKIPMASSVGAGEGELDLVNWAGYAEDGTNDKTVDWVHPFEKQTGCKVNSKIG